MTAAEVCLPLALEHAHELPTTPRPQRRCTGQPETLVAIENLVRDRLEPFETLGIGHLFGGRGGDDALDEPL